MLSSADGYCSIVVFDLAELGTIHPTQQHHRQLQAIAQATQLPHTSVSTPAQTPIPHSPAISTMRQSPAPPRSERESSASSSIIAGSQIPPISLNQSLPPFGSSSSSNSNHPPPPSSTTSSADLVLPTPGEESDSYSFVRPSGSESGSSVTGLGILGEAEFGTQKRESVDEDAAPKKKRRVALTHLGSGEEVE